MLFVLLLICAPELVIHRGHSNTVFDFRVSADGRYALTASSDESARLWDLASGKDIRAFNGRTGSLSNANFASDMKTLLTVSEKQTTLWETNTGKLLRRFTHKVVGDKDTTGSLDIMSGELSPDGTLVATGDRAGHVNLWDARTGARVKELLAVGQVHAVTFSPDGSTLFVTADGSVYWWGVRSNQSGNWKAHTIAFSIRSSADGKSVITGGDKEAKLWNVSSASLMQTFTGHTDFVSAGILSKDGKLAVTGSWDRSAKLWDVASGKEIRSFVDGKTIVLAVGLSTDNNYVHLAGGAPTLRELATGRVVLSLNERAERIDALSLTADGRRMLTMRLKTAMLWDLPSGKQIRTFFHGPMLQAAVLSPNGRYVFTAAFAKTDSKLWDAATGAEIRSFPYSNNLIVAAAFSPDSQLLATGGSDAVVRIWELATGKLIASLKEHKEEIKALAFSHDGRMLASAGWDTSLLWDVVSQKLLRKLPTFATQSLAFSPDDKLILAGTLSAVARVLDTQSGEEQRYLGEKGSDIIYSCAFSPDGKLALTGSRDASAKLWDVASGKLLSTMVSDHPWVSSVAFGSPGTFLTAGRDGATHLWHLETRRKIASFVSIDETDYAIVTPDLYYTASKGATRGVSFVQGLEVFTFDNFDLMYNRPDIILSRTGAGSLDLAKVYKEAYTKRLKTLGVVEAQLSLEMHLPQVSITSRDEAMETRNKQATFTVKAVDSAYELDRLNVFVNDVPIYGAQGLPLKGRQREQKISLTLSNGVNKVQVSVRNVKGAESIKQTFVTHYVGPAAPSKTYAVVIGVSDYDDTSMSLRYAAKDANDLATLLEAKGVTTIRLTNAEATREKILAAKAKLLTTQVDDQVILFVAGHGLLDEKLDWYFATRDVSFDAPAGRGISYEALEGLLDGIPARRKLLLMDACHSGEVDKEQSVLVADKTSAVNRRGFKVRVRRVGLSNSFEVMQDLFANLQRGSGAMVISSASGAEYAYESASWKNGVFTYALLEGLKTKNADQNKDGQIAVSEIRDYIMSRVDSLTAGQQHPTSRRENLADDFTIY